jgi:4-diphosphocytidyl-2C-methyl-D-erythritol kinase
MSEIVTDPTRRLTPVIRLAPAKLNLTLAVVGRRQDGYHALHSVFVPLGLSDRLSLSPAAAERDTLHVTGFDAGPIDDNLVLRGLAAIRAAVGRGWPGGPALVEGRGELVAPLHGLHGSPGVLLLTPAIAVSTPDVFAIFDGLGGRGNEATRMSSNHIAEELRSGLSAADLAARAGALTVSNDLMQATLVLVPALVPFRRALSRLLAQPIGLSGSGPTLWALYPSQGEAAIAAEAVRVALRDGRLSAPGSAAPFVTATTILNASQQGREP